MSHFLAPMHLKFQLLVEDMMHDGFIVDISPEVEISELLNGGVI
jgi:hypothetical protein